MKAFLIAIAIVFGGLVVTNPGRDEYLDWVQHQDQADPLGTMMTSLARPFLNAGTKVENFTLFTVFTTSFDETHKSLTLGVLHHFYGVSAAAAPWHPGERSPTYPHVVAAQSKDQWLPEAGYRWINEPPPPGDFRVRWVPGLAEEALPHVVTATAEGQWFPEDGYQWVTLPPKPGDLRVRWVPGQRSAHHEHVLAAPQEERWLPEQGFAWLANPPPPGDFRVMHVAPDGPAPLPRFRGSVLRRCGGQDHFAPESPCWFQADNGIYVASKRGNMRSTTFKRWPSVDDELAGLEALEVTMHECDRPCIHWELPIYSSVRSACESAFPAMKPLKFAPPYRGRCVGERRPQIEIDGRWVNG